MSPSVSRRSSSRRADAEALERRRATELADEASRVHPQDVGPLFGQATWLLDHPLPAEPSGRWRRAWNLVLGDSDSSA